MNYKNNPSGYGLVSRIFHWISVVFVYSLFGVGLYMTSLTYYDPGYHQLPELHKGFGIIFALLMLMRFGWRIYSPPPQPIAHTPNEKRLAKVIHWSFYALIFTIIFSGYLISTAKGKGINVFDIFTVPALVSIENDLIGEAHLWLAYFLVGLSALHIGASLMHHFRYKDATLKRMIFQTGD